MRVEELKLNACAAGGGTLTSLQLVTAQASEQSRISVNCLLGGSCGSSEMRSGCRKIATLQQKDDSDSGVFEPS